MTALDASSLYRLIGERIRGMRERKLPKVSQRVLAGKIGLSRASMANIENGRHRVQIHVLYDIARELGGDPLELLPVPSPSELPLSFSENLNPTELKAVQRLLAPKEPRDA